MILKIPSNGTGVVIAEGDTQDPVDQENSDDRPRHDVENLSVLHRNELVVKGQRAVNDHQTENAEARARVKANTSLEIHEVIAVIPKHGKGSAEKLNDVRSRKLDHGSNETDVYEQQNESDVQLADIQGLLDLLTENTVDQHTAKAVNGKPRTEEEASVGPDAVVKICPDHFINPSAHGEKDKQQQNISYNIKFLIGRQGFISIQYYFKKSDYI